MTLDDISIDFEAIMSKTRSVPEQVAGIVPGDLRVLTEEIYARLDEATAGARDVTFIPDDLEGDASEGGKGWNLAHVVVHLTAGLEENAAQASTLARGRRSPVDRAPRRRGRKSQRWSRFGSG